MLWPPYFDKDPNTKEITGLGADFYRGMADLIDLEIAYVEVVVGQQVEDLRLGKIDAVCNDGPYVFSAIKFVDYSKPAYYSPVFAYVRHDDPRFQNAPDLNNPDVSIVVIDGDLGGPLSDRNFPKARVVSLPAITDVASMLMNVVTKKADATIVDSYAVIHFNQNNPPGLRPLSESTPIAVYPVGFSVKKGETPLLNMLNAGIDAMWNTNSALPILRKYDATGKAFFPVARPYEAPD